LWYHILEERAQSSREGITDYNLVDFWRSIECGMART